MGEAHNFKQELVAVFCKPVAENPTQAMIEAAFHHHGLDWRYLTIEVDPAHLGDAVRVDLVNRSVERGEKLRALLADRLGIEASYHPWKGRFAVPPDADVVINATSIGLYPDIDARMPIDFDSLKPGMVVADVIPNPPKTHFLEIANERGCRVIDGLEMLINQGVIGLKYWTGIDADPAIMRSALESIFSGGE